jgi:cytochrome P450
MKDVIYTITLFFPEMNLRSVITDLFIAGSETTFTTLRWVLLYIAYHTDIQEKVFREIDSVFGDRSPSMSDKRRTPFTEATLNEIQRLNTLVPFGVGHSNLQSDFEIEGYPIPRGTIIISNLHQIHMDKNIWKKPNEFDPNNFLDDQGQIINQDKLVQFSIGKAQSFYSIDRYFSPRPEATRTLVMALFVVVLLGYFSDLLLFKSIHSMKIEKMHR